MISFHDAVTRLRRVPPQRLPVAVGRLAVRTARARARRWNLERNRGELSEAELRRAFGGATPEAAFDGFLARFFVEPSAARERALALATARPDLAERTRRAAQQAIEHVVDLLGSGPVELGPRIDWHIDFKTGIGWRRDVLADDLEGLRLDEPCDIKVPWELSRCQHFVALGRAYALDRDSRYAREFVDQLQAWLDDNPWPYGVNWSRAMEAAVRSINWLWAAALFGDAPEFDAAVKTRLLRSLLQHGRFIAKNLEISDNNGNHYLSNGVGLLFLGVLFPDLADAAAWRRTGEQIAWREIERQVYADGVDFEQGLGYHGLVLEFWYSSVLLCERNDLAVPAHVRPRLERMFEFVEAYTRPDGTFPQIGDNDDGRLSAIDDEPVGSHRRHLNVGAAMFGRREWLNDAVETATWLLGPEVLAMQPVGARAESRGFAEGGFYVLRTADTSMVVDAGEVGMRGIGGHGHNDVLSFDLWAAGTSLLVDSGTYAYSADPHARQAMRSTTAHNAVRVDGQETSRLGGGRWLWQIANDAHPKVLSWTSTDERDVLSAEHDGYARLPQPVIHCRTITFDKQRLAWRIDDDLAGSGEHLLEVFFHPGVVPVREDGAVLLRAERGGLWLFPPGDLRQEQGWISREYGQREPAIVLVYAVRAALPTRLTTHLVLAATGTPSHAARSLVQDS